MSTTTKTVKTAEEKLAEKNAKIQQLQKQKQAIIKRENAKERKERTHRLCRRHGLFENYLPELIAMTDQQFEMFIKRGIKTKYGIKILYEILEQPIPHELAEQFGIAIPNDNVGNAKPPQAAQSGA